MVDIKLYNGTIVDKKTIKLKNIYIEDFPEFTDAKVKRAKDIFGNDLYADDLAEIETFYDDVVRQIAFETLAKKLG